uniref:Tetraspanin n=1 Tax=Ciona intestinalis TaxID=7719 RepID=F6TTN6_CIOIN|nr:tetraspanin-9 [Ciona intestinalis]|eukprot:XP_002121375.1 tetraspanin-9 [Ciona intestinalis]
MESKGLNCCKYLMFLFNLLIFLCGCVLLGLSVWAYVNADSFKKIISSDPVIFNSLIVLIAVGAVLIVAGFFGCLGAIQESKCLLGTFFTIVLVIFIAEIVGAILIYVYYPKAKDLALQSMQNYNTTTKQPWDILQTTFKCCGFTNYSDWGSTIPSTCCSDAASPCSPSMTTFYPLGCEAAIRKYFWIIGGIGIGIIVFEILAMIFACCLFQNIGDYEMA